MTWLWLAAVVMFAIVEATTAGLVSVWFVAGSVAALVASTMNMSVPVQLVVFCAVTALTLALTRPLVKRLNREGKTPTNSDRVIGLTGKVTETVDNDGATGAVYVDGKTWTARSAHEEVLPVGSKVRVLRIEGVKLLVEPTDAAVPADEKEEVAAWN